MGKHLSSLHERYSLALSSLASTSHFTMLHWEFKCTYHNSINYKSLDFDKESPLYTEIKFTGQWFNSHRCAKSRANWERGSFIDEHPTYNINMAFLIQLLYIPLLFMLISKNWNLGAGVVCSEPRNWKWAVRRPCLQTCKLHEPSCWSWSTSLQKNWLSQRLYCLIQKF